MAIVWPRSVTARRTPDRTRFRWRLKCAFRSRIPTLSMRDYKLTRCSHVRGERPVVRTCDQRRWRSADGTGAVVDERRMDLGVELDVQELFTLESRIIGGTVASVFALEKALYRTEELRGSWRAGNHALLESPSNELRANCRRWQINGETVSLGRQHSPGRRIHVVMRTVRSSSCA